MDFQFNYLSWISIGICKFIPKLLIELDLLCKEDTADIISLVWQKFLFLYRISFLGLNGITPVGSTYSELLTGDKKLSYDFFINTFVMSAPTIEKQNNYKLRFILRILLFFNRVETDITNEIVSIIKIPGRLLIKSVPARKSKLH